MTRVQYVQFESDSAGIGEFLTVLSRGLSQAMEIPAPAKTVPALLPAPAPAKCRKAKVNGHRAAPPAMPAAPVSFNDHMRRLIAESPRSLLELVECIKRSGTEINSQQASSALSYLRSKNEIYRDDADGKWHPAKAARK